MKRLARPTAVFAVVLLALVVVVAGCRSYHIEATVVNHSGGAVTLVEVDYPSASFGANNLAVDAVLHYRFQTRGDGPVTVQYTPSGRQQVQISGPTLYERQEGKLEIVLLPAGKAEFNAALTPQH
jgi:hypothetical protein